jgi:hypothetical protein
MPQLIFVKNSNFMFKVFRPQWSYFNEGTIVIMAFFDENTSVVRMKRDFDQFVQDHDESRGVGIFSLDKLNNESYKNRSGDSGSVSVQALLGKYFVELS